MLRIASIFIRNLYKYNSNRKYSLKTRYGWNIDTMKKGAENVSIIHNNFVLFFTSWFGYHNTQIIFLRDTRFLLCVTIFFFRLFTDDNHNDVRHHRKKCYTNTMTMIALYPKVRFRSSTPVALVSDSTTTTTTKQKK